MLLPASKVSWVDSCDAMASVMIWLDSATESEAAIVRMSVCSVDDAYGIVTRVLSYRPM